MKPARNPVLALVLALLAVAVLLPAQAAERIRLLIVTGGHDFETNQFYQVFRENPDVVFTAAQHPNAQAWFRADQAATWDVLVFYDMWQNIDDEAKTNLVARLKEGKGLVVLHHAIANYQKWPEYEKIIGAKYYLEKTNVAGVEKARSIYKHGVQFRVHIANNRNPVTRGMTDFDILDETYNLFDVAPGLVHLVTTEEPTSNSVIGWAKSYEKARVVYLQSGHDHSAYENPNYRKLVAQAIRWVGRQK